jgi:hypothetical protein
VQRSSRWNSPRPSEVERRRPADTKICNIIATTGYMRIAAVAALVNDVAGKNGGVGATSAMGVGEVRGFGLWKCDLLWYRSK